MTIVLYAGLRARESNHRCTFGSSGRSIGKAIQRQIAQPSGMSPTVNAS